MTSKSDYNFIRLLGQGSFGQVFLAERAGNPQKHFAVKVQNKKHIEENQHKMKNALNEIQVLKLAVGKKFLSQIQCSFMDYDNLYIVLDFEDGGDLHRFIYRKDYKPNIELWTFAAVNILNGLKQLELINVIHNDLKPENILIHADGYLRIADFGLSIICDQDCGRKGTKLYCAPECSDKNVHNRTADYFSAGIALYELSEKRMPFKNVEDLESKDPDAAVRIISDVWTFLKELLQKDPYLRISSIAEAKLYSCFEEGAFELIGSQKSPSPFKSYVEHHPILNILELNFNFCRESQIKPQVNVECQTSPVIIIEYDPTKQIAIDVVEITDATHEENEQIPVLVNSVVKKASVKELYKKYECIEDKYVCKIVDCCEKSFKTLRTFKQHARDISCKESEKFKCEICGEIFPREAKLKLHAKMHQKSNELQ